MLNCLVYAIVRLMLEGVIVGDRPNARLRVEVLALRHPWTGVLERQVSSRAGQPQMGRLPETTAPAATTYPTEPHELILRLAG